jgi:hypothetical protein
MLRSSLGTLLLLAIGVLPQVVFPQPAAAGGTEFPADGTRNLGRGGAGMARADDPSVMIRNPALLADLWGDQALLGAHLLLVDSCFQASGGYGVGVATNNPQVARIGDQYLFSRVPAGSTDLEGRPLTIVDNEPYPNVCYQGPAPFLPRLALTMKLAPDLGVGIGFFPPDNTSLNQFGNRDGTIETENGLRANPLRHIRSHLNTSYFSVLGALGYRVADWLKVGFGFQWQLVVFQGRNFTPAISVSGLSPSGDVRVDSWGRDLFVPGVIGSVQITPFDALDIALGFKWSDRVMGKAKLDLTSSAFGAGVPVPFNDSLLMAERTLDSTVPYTLHNQAAEVSAGPVWVPQLSAGIRFADRLKPRVKDKSWGATMKSNGGLEEDSMASERWDIELDVIYYMASFQDRTDVTTKTALVELRTVAPDGSRGATPISVGDCIKPNRALMPMEECQLRRVRIPTKGQDQMTFRLGGDYNILPGLFTVRAGASYETDGQTPDWMSPFQYMAGRIGLHSGLTVRIAGRTDFSLGFAYFMQKEVRTQINPESLATGDYRFYLADPDRYHIANGGVGGLDGTAMIEAPNSSRPLPGPYYVNAGSYFYDLSVLSASISQKF